MQVLPPVSNFQAICSIILLSSIFLRKERRKIFVSPVSEQDCWRVDGNIIRRNRKKCFSLSMASIFFSFFSVLSNFPSVYRTSTTNLTEEISQQRVRSKKPVNDQNVDFLDPAHTSEIPTGEEKHLVLLNERIVIVLVYAEKQYRLP